MGSLVIYLSLFLSAFFTVASPLLVHSATQTRPRCGEIFGGIAYPHNLSFSAPAQPLKPTGQFQKSRGEPQWYEDSKGVRWLLKPDALTNELESGADAIASRIYLKLGYNAAISYPLDMNGRRYTASRSLGEDLSSSTLQDHTDSPEFRRLRFFAAYLKDWDRLQYGPNNFDLGNGRFAMYDFGGTLGSSARGRAKKGGPPFSPAIGNFESTDNISLLYDSFEVNNLPENHPWNKVTRDDALEAIHLFETRLDDRTLKKIVASARYSNPLDSAYMLKALIKRRDGFVSYLLERFPLTIQEISMLEDGRGIPENILKEYDSRTIAESMVTRFHQRHESNPPNSPTAYNFMKDSEIQLFFDIDKIDQKTGEVTDGLTKRIVNGFLTLHEVRPNWPKGAIGRAPIEDTFLKIKPRDIYNTNKKDPAHKLRPKYAHLDLTVKGDFGQPSQFLIEAFSQRFYGRFALVMKDEVKRRSTLTYRDSLGLKNDVAHSFWYRPEVKPKMIGGGPYFEAQIFGEVEFTDGKYILMAPDYTKIELERLKKVGLPLWTYEKVIDHGRLRFLRKELVYEGRLENPEPLK